MLNTGFFSFFFRELWSSTLRTRSWKSPFWCSACWRRNTRNAARPSTGIYWCSRSRRTIPKSHTDRTNRPAIPSLSISSTTIPRTSSKPPTMTRCWRPPMRNSAGRIPSKRGRCTTSTSTPAAPARGAGVIRLPSWCWTGLEWSRIWISIEMGRRNCRTSWLSRICRISRLTSVDSAFTWVPFTDSGTRADQLSKQIHWKWIPTDCFREWYQHWQRRASDCKKPQSKNYPYAALNYTFYRSTDSLIDSFYTEFSQYQKLKCAKWFWKWYIVISCRQICYPLFHWRRQNLLFLYGEWNFYAQNWTGEQYMKSFVPHNPLPL